MRDTIKGACIGAFVVAAVSVLLAQTTPSWTSPRTWATDDLLTAAQFNAQIRDNFLNMRGFAACAENGTTGTSSALTVLYGDCRWAAGGVADDSVTQAKMADDAVGPAEMDPESATAGQVMMIGAGGDPGWTIPFEFPRTRSARAIDTSPDGDFYITTTSTIDAGDTDRETIRASATFTLSSITGLGCQVRIDTIRITSSGFGVTTFTTNGAKTVTTDVRVSTGIRGSAVPVSVEIRRVGAGASSGCTVNAGATLTLTIP